MCQQELNRSEDFVNKLCDKKLRQRGDRRQRRRSCERKVKVKKKCQPKQFFIEK